MKNHEKEHQIAVRLLLTIGILVFGLVVPFLEINDTHVFNPNWTPHSLIHEVWQLVTNTLLAVVCLWLVWIKKETYFPSLIGMIITGSFLFAYLIQDLYGGSMKYLDGSEKTLLGLNIGLLGFGIVFSICVYSFVVSRKGKTGK